MWCSPSTPLPHGPRPSPIDVLSEARPSGERVQTPARPTRDVRKVYEFSYPEINTARMRCVRILDIHVFEYQYYG